MEAESKFQDLVGVSAWSYWLGDWPGPFCSALLSSSCKSRFRFWTTPCFFCFLVLYALTLLSSLCTPFLYLIVSLLPMEIMTWQDLFFWSTLVWRPVTPWLVACFMWTANVCRGGDLRQLLSSFFRLPTKYLCFNKKNGKGEETLGVGEDNVLPVSE